MRLLTTISIASLVVSIAAVVFVLGLYAELNQSEIKVSLAKDKIPQARTQTFQSPECHLLSKYMTTSLTDRSSDQFTSVWIAEDCNKEFKVDNPKRNIKNKSQLRLSQVENLIESYNQSADGKRFEKCLWMPVDSGSRFSVRADRIEYKPEENRWHIQATGGSCKGIESFSVDDQTGEVSYLGSSLDK